MINLTTYKLRVLNGETAIKILKIKPQTGTSICNVYGKEFISFIKHSSKSIRKTPTTWY